MAKKTLPQRLHDDFRLLVRDGDIEGIDKLLKENKIDINASLYRIEKGKEEEGGFYLFHEVISGKNVLEKIDYFVKKGADLEVKYNGANLLHRLFITNDHLPTLKKLLVLGLDVHGQNESGQTLITKLVRIFSSTIIHNYDDEQVKNMHRQKPDADYSLEFQFVELLLKHGADYKQKDSNETSALDWLLHRKETGEWNLHHDKLQQLFLKYG